MHTMHAVVESYGANACLTRTDHHHGQQIQPGVPKMLTQQSHHDDQAEIKQEP
jgi:hypothetical protein